MSQRGLADRLRGGWLRIAIASGCAVALVAAIIIASPWRQTHVDQRGLGAWVLPSGSTAEVHLVDTAESGVACPLSVPARQQHVTSDGLHSVLWSSASVQPILDDSCKSGTAIKTRAQVRDVVVGGGLLGLSTQKGALRASTTSTEPVPVGGNAKEPSVGMGANGTMAIASNGAVLLLSASETSPRRSALSVSGCTIASCQVAVVDDQPVVLVRKTQQLRFASGRTINLASGAQLSSSPPSGGVVVISSGSMRAFGATGESQWTISKPSAEPLAAGGDASGCSYGAFKQSTSVSLVRRCSDGSVTSSSVQPASGAGCDPAQLNRTSGWRFQPSVQSAVLNAPNGDAYLLVGGKARCLEWKTLAPSNSQTSTQRDRTLDQDQHHPTCNPTTFYWQSNLSTAPEWPAVESCHDAVGYPLWVTQPISPGFTVGSTGSTVTPTTASTAPQSGSVNYSVTDGTSAATANSATITTDLNSYPGPKSRQPAHPLYLGTGGSGVYDVLSDWYTQLGTPLTVTAVSLVGSAGGTQAHLDGSGRFQVINFSGQPLTAQVTITDTLGKTSTDSIPILPTGQQPVAPVVHDLTRSLEGGKSLNVDLTLGDTDPSGGQLTVSAFKAVGALGTAHCRIADGQPNTASCEAGGAQSTSSSSYSFVVTSTASNLSAPAFLRVTTLPGGPLPGELRLGSVSLSLPATQGGQATADLLAPEATAGPPQIAVTSFDCPPTIGCQLLEGRYLRLVAKDATPSAKPLRVGFQATDGSSSGRADLWVSMVPVPLGATPQLAVAGSQQVPVGGVLKVPVLVGAYSPTGAPFVVTSSSLPISCSSFDTWTDGSEVFVAARSGSSGSCQLDYVAQELQGFSPVSVTASFSVSVQNPAPAAPPLPTLTLRVFKDSGTVELPLGVGSQDGDALQTSSSLVAWLPATVGGHQSPTCGVANLTKDRSAVSYVVKRSAANCSVDEFSYEMRYLDGSLHSGTVKVVGISSQATCPDPSAAPVLRYVPRGTQNLKISLLSAISDPCGRTVSIGEVFGASSCINVKVGRAGSEGQLSLSGLDTCSGASASLSYRFSAGTSPLQSSTVTILLNAVSISQMTARSDLALLAPGQSVQLGAFVTGNIGALSFSRTTGSCSVSADGTLSAPGQSDATSISSCGFKATDGATGQSVGGVVWLAGKTPIIEQLRSDPIIVPSRGGSKTVDLLGGSQPYFTAFPTSVQVVERTQPELAGCDAAGTVSSSGDSSVTLHGGQGLQQSQTCRLIVTLGVGSLIDRESFGISVVFQGAQPPKLQSCPLPTLHPAIRVIWDLSSCVDPGGYDISSLTLKVTGSSLFTTVDQSQLQGGAPSLSLLPVSDHAGQKAMITLTLSDGVGGDDTQPYSWTIQPAPCEVSSTSSLVTLKPGESQTVPASIVVTGSDSCQWKLTSAAVTTGVPKDSTAQVSSSDDHKINLRAGTPDGGSQIHFTVGYRAVISTDSSISTSGTIEVTVLSKPAPPQSVSAALVDGGEKLNVSWVPPTLRGDGPESPLTYELQCSSPDGGRCDPSPCPGTTGTTCLVSGLSNGKTYQFKVRATNSVGPSDWSELSAGIRPATAPAAPAAPTVSNQSGTIAVDWGAPNPTGSTITGYSVEYQLQGQEWQFGCTTPDTSCSISTPLGIDARFQVQAISSDQGSGSFSQPSASIRASTTPGVVTNLVAAPGSQNGEIAVTWVQPASNGSDIRSYVVQHSSDNSPWVPDDACNAPNSLSCTIGGLDQAVVWMVRVTAINSNGQGSWATSTAVAPHGKPVSPANVLADTGVQPGEIQLHWTDPTLANSGSSGGITGHAVRYSSDGGLNWKSADMCTTQDSSCTVTGLDETLSFIFQVQAKNGNTDSPMSDWSVSSSSASPGQTVPTSAPPETTVPA